jgi:hypothetical protein
MKLADSNCVLRVVTIKIGAEDLIDVWDMKTACNSALFFCPKGCGVGNDSDELAVVVSVGGCERKLLEISILVQTCVTMSVCLTVLGARVRGVVLVELGDFLTFLTFSCFWVKLAIVDRFLKAVMVVEGAVEFKEVKDGVSEVKTVILGKILLVVPIFFFLFS